MKEHRYRNAKASCYVVSSPWSHFLPVYTICCSSIHITSSDIFPTVTSRIGTSFIFRFHRRPIQLVKWGVVMMEHLFVFNVWSYANGPFSEFFEDLYKKLFGILSWRNQFCEQCSVARLLASSLFCHTSSTFVSPNIPCHCLFLGQLLCLLSEAFHLEMLFDNLSSPILLTLKFFLFLSFFFNFAC